MSLVFRQDVEPLGLTEDEIQHELWPTLNNPIDSEASLLSDILADRIDWPEYEQRLEAVLRRVVPDRPVPDELARKHRGATNFAYPVVLLLVAAVIAWVAWSATTTDLAQKRAEAAHQRLERGIAWARHISNEFTVAERNAERCLVVVCRK